MSADTSGSTDLSTTPANQLKPLGYARRSWIPPRDNNKPVSPSTVYRWGKKGVKGVKLKMLFGPDGAVTSEAACREFLIAVDAARRAEMSPAIDATESELKRAGLQ
ncbi:MAG: DUF1580 domain-containing protein [Fuerstiella sp.]|nr:DUF1580 domain-containing protein [Fuerstiella sp.]